MRRTIHVPRDKSLSYRLPGPASKIVIAQPEIAKVTATSETSFYVQGMEFGSTNMLVYDRSGRLSEVIDIRVGYDGDGLQQDLSAAFPNEPIQVRNLGEALMLTGEVSDSGVQASAEKIAAILKKRAEAARRIEAAGHSARVTLVPPVFEAYARVLAEAGATLPARPVKPSRMLPIFRAVTDSFVQMGADAAASVDPLHGPHRRPAGAVRRSWRSWWSYRLRWGPTSRRSRRWRPGRRHRRRR